MCKNLVLTVALSALSLASFAQDQAATPTPASDASQAVVNHLINKVDSVYKSAVNQFDKHKSFCEQLHTLVLVDSKYISEMKKDMNNIRKSIDDLNARLGRSTGQLAPPKTSSNKAKRTPQAMHNRTLKPKTIAALKKLREKRMALRETMKKAANGKIAKKDKKS